MIRLGYKILFCCMLMSALITKAGERDIKGNLTLYKKDGSTVITQEPSVFISEEKCWNYYLCDKVNLTIKTLKKDFLFKFKDDNASSILNILSGLEVGSLPENKVVISKNNYEFTFKKNSLTYTSIYKVVHRPEFCWQACEQEETSCDGGYNEYGQCQHESSNCLKYKTQCRPAEDVCAEIGSEKMTFVIEIRTQNQKLFATWLSEIKSRNFNVEVLMDKCKLTDN